MIFKKVTGLTHWWAENLLLPSATVVAERLCFHKCLSVHRGRCTPLPWQAEPDSQTPPGQTPPPPDIPPTSRRLLQLMVRILLECILVLIKRSISTKSCMRVYCLPPDNVRNNRSIQYCCTFELKKILIVIGYTNIPPWPVSAIYPDTKI